jgi:hypothetical protein
MRSAGVGVGELSRGGLVEGIRLVYDRRREEQIHVSDAPNARWSDARPEARVSAEAELAEQQLALVDRIIGLEQQVKELQNARLLSPSETVAVEGHLAGIRASPTWRAGRIVTLPLRTLRYVKRRVLG